MVRTRVFTLKIGAAIERLVSGWVPSFFIERFRSAAESLALVGSGQDTVPKVNYSTREEADSIECASVMSNIAFIIARLKRSVSSFS